MSPNQFASRVTADLQSEHPDKHLRLVASNSSRTSGRPRMTMRAGSAPSRDVPPSAPGADQLFTPIDMDQLPEVARKLFADQAGRNHYFTKVEVLPGNIGYVDYDQFGIPNSSTRSADAAFTFVAETDAIILDLRGNRGGAEGMNQYIASHFFGKDPVHLYSRFYGNSATTQEYFTFPDHVKHRFPERPLFVLVDSGTGSAAENLSFALQGLERATIVGATTTGAAHSSRGIDLEHGLALQLPIARAFNPRTNEDWEGVGVVPDEPCSSASALPVAHSLAVDRLLSSATGERKSALEDAKLVFRAQQTAPTPSNNLDSFTGKYGNRRIFVEGGKLKLVRTDVPDASAVDLLLLADDYFTLAQSASARIRFERNDSGEVTRLHVRLPTGDWEVSDRLDHP